MTEITLPLWLWGLILLAANCITLFGCFLRDRKRDREDPRLSTVSGFSVEGWARAEGDDADDPEWCFDTWSITVRLHNAEDVDELGASLEGFDA